MNNTKWEDPDTGMVYLNEIAFIQPVMDRFDLEFLFKSMKDKKAIREFADRKKFGRTAVEYPTIAAFANGYGSLHCLHFRRSFDWKPFVW
jgi:hypothetical protein